MSREGIVDRSATSRARADGTFGATPADSASAAVVQEDFRATAEAVRDALLNELRERLIHIEWKTDDVLGRLAAAGSASHPDQAFGGRTYAQFGEDLIILNIFHMLGIARPSYLDIGAHHPFTISNTALLYARGSRGINVEANPHLIEAFHQHRSEDININAGVGPERGTLDFYFIDDWSGRNTFLPEVAKEFVTQHPDFQIRKVQPIRVVTPNDIVLEHAGGRFPDLLTIDVEGMDFDILRAASFNKDRPTVICVEAEASDKPNRSADMIGLLAERGYVPYTRTVANLLFVHHRAADALGMHAVMSRL